MRSIVTTVIGVCRSVDDVGVRGLGLAMLWGMGRPQPPGARFILLQLLVSYPDVLSTA